ATVERIHAGTAERIDAPDAVAGVATWALTPRVLWVAPSAGGETRVALPVRVPPGARLRLRAGVNPDLWQTLGPFPVRLRVGLAAVVIQLPIFDRWLALLDEGYLLELADEVNRGKLLYRDVYVDAPLPGAFYVLAAWFRIAGTSIWSSRLLAVALFALLAMLL